MATFDILPSEIINEILFKFLNISDIKSCLLTSKQFHVFNNYQTNILQNASKGWYHCIINGLIDSCQWLYYNKIINSKQINTTICVSTSYYSLPPHLDTENSEIGEDNNELIDILKSYNYKKYSKKPLILCTCNYFNKELHIHNKIAADSFRISCQMGHLKISQWLYELIFKKYPKIIDINSKIFPRICQNGYLDMAKWFIGLINKPSNIYSNIDSIIMASQNGHIEMVKWLYDQITKGKDISIIDLLESSERYYKEVLVMRYNLDFDNSRINSREILDIVIFHLSILNNHVDVAKWIYNTNPKIYSYYKDKNIVTKIYIILCEKSHIHTAKLFYDIFKPDMSEVVPELVMLDRKNLNNMIGIFIKLDILNNTGFIIYLFHQFVINNYTNMHVKYVNRLLKKYSKLD